MHADAEEGTATGVAVAITRACEATDADAGVFTGAATYADVGTGTETIDAAYIVECMGSVGMGETAEDIGSDWGAEGGNDGGADSSGGWAQ